jgi:hypothetical protein
VPARARITRREFMSYTITRRARAVALGTVLLAAVAALPRCGGTRAAGADPAGGEAQVVLQVRGLT